MERKESEICLEFYPREVTANILDISIRQLARDVKVLRKVLRGEFGHKRWVRGFTPEQFKILSRYRALRLIGMTSEQAAQHIRINGDY